MQHDADDMLRRESSATPQVRVRRGRRGTSGGQMVIMFALTFSLFMFGLIATVIDLATLYSDQALLARAAQDGAVGGAANVDVTVFRSTGKVHLATSPSSSTGGVKTLAASGSGPCALAVKADFVGLSSSGVKVNCAVPAAPNDFQVTVTVTDTVNLPIRLGFGSATITTTYSALAQCGTDTADATCS